MPSEKSTLLSSSNTQKGSNSQLTGPFGNGGSSSSFVNPRTTEQRIFVGFLFFMIVCLIALSFSVIFDSGSDAREISYFDKTAFSSIDLLNSLYREPSTLESGCESTLLLIRHCDKNTDADGVVHHGGNNYCSWLGRERAYFFASLFDPNNPQRRYPAPSKIFALTQERDVTMEKYANGKSNYREIETVMPLANKFNLDIDVYKFDVQVLAADYFELIQSGDMCGKVTVVSWKHEFIAELALALGCGPAEGCPRTYPEDSFDEVWQIKYVFDPRGKAKTSPDPMDLPVETKGPLTLYVPYGPTIGDLPINDLDDNGDEDDDNTPNRQVRRALKKKHHKKKPKEPKESKESNHQSKHHKLKKWSVYGTKTFQVFDPLQYSMAVGDYPPGGSPSGGKWADEI